MSKSILEVVEQAHSSKNQMSKRTKMQIVDAYGRASLMKKILEDFLKVNRSLMIDWEEAKMLILLMAKITKFKFHKKLVRS